MFAVLIKQISLQGRGSTISFCVLFGDLAVVVIEDIGT